MFAAVTEIRLMLTKTEAIEIVGSGGRDAWIWGWVECPHPHLVPVWAFPVGEGKWDIREDS